MSLRYSRPRDMGVRGILVYCADFRCGHCVAMSADEWPDGVRLSDIEPRFVCRACGKGGQRFGRTSIGTDRPGDGTSEIRQAKPSDLPD
jgi:hypothetical protein